MVFHKNQCVQRPKFWPYSCWMVKWYQIYNTHPTFGVIIHNKDLCFRFLVIGDFHFIMHVGKNNIFFCSPDFLLIQESIIMSSLSLYAHRVDFLLFPSSHFTLLECLYNHGTWFQRRWNDDLLPIQPGLQMWNISPWTGITNHQAEMINST